MSLTDDQTAALRKKIILAIASPIQPVTRTGNYRLRLFTVGLVTLIIVFLYIAMILFAAWNIFAFLGAGPVATPARGRGGAFLFLLTSAAPAFASFCVLVALVKPLLARGAKGGEDSTMELSKKYEPFLYEFVEQLCQSLGSPVPSSIAVDANVNASASYLRGPWDKRLRLTVGLPLVLGLNTRQLAGVLSHEFGHFTQRGGMLLTWLIRTVNSRLYRAAFERDRWDEWLVESSRSWDIRIGWVLFVARGVVWLARLALRGLFMAGAFFCSGLLQEMEFDADRYEARMAGSRAFAQTCRQMRLLNICHAGSIEDLDRFRREGRLPDNLPALVVANIPLVPPEAFRKMEEKLLQVETGKFDTHPSDHDRIVNAASEQAEGAFQIEVPGSILFRDALGLARLVTIRLYKDAFGAGFDAKQVHATEELVGQLNRETADLRSGMNFLLNQFCMYRTFTLPRRNIGSKIDTVSWKKLAISRREKLMRAAPGYVALRRESSAVMDEIVQVAAVRRLLAANFDLAQTSRKFIVNDERSSRARLLELSRRETDVQGKLEPFRQVLGSRLMDALELTRSETVREKIGESAEVSREISMILNCWNTISDNRMMLDRFVVDVQSAFILLPLIDETRHDRVVVAMQENVIQRQKYLLDIKSVFSEVRYPFSHASGNVSLGLYLIKKLPSRENHGQILDDSMELIKSLGIVMQRCASRLGSIAERTENAFGLKPLELPPGLIVTDEDEQDSD